jgi:hypothetical protein
MMRPAGRGTSQGGKSVKDYVVQSGPLRSFDALFDNRFDKLKQVADFHTIQITGKPTTQRIHINRLSRSTERELAFVSTLFASIAEGQKTILAVRDVATGRASQLIDKLTNQKEFRRDLPPLVYSHLQYGTAEDDFVALHLKNFTTDFQILAGCVPPSEGVLAFYLTSSPFDIFDIHWQRACRDSLRAREDRIRRDILSIAHEAQTTLFMDADGSFAVILHPKVKDVEAVEEKITAAGKLAGMHIIFAPGLFS